MSDESVTLSRFVKMDSIFLNIPHISICVCVCAIEAELNKKCEVSVNEKCDGFIIHFVISNKESCRFFSHQIECFDELSIPMTYSEKKKNIMCLFNIYYISIYSQC